LGNKKEFEEKGRRLAFYAIVLVVPGELEWAKLE
jgi:hypothetical protein